MSIERTGTNERSSKIVKHNGVVYLSGQVGDGESIVEQANDCLGRVDTLLKEAGSSREQMLQAIVWLSGACGRSELAREILKVEVIVTAAYE